MINRPIRTEAEYKAALVEIETLKATLLRKT